MPVGRPGFMHDQDAPGTWSSPDPIGLDELGSASASFGAAAKLTQVLYATEAGDTAAISINDVHQGQIGDCFLISSIGELALTHPTAISNMIRTNADGTETVTLYVDKSGALPTTHTTAFKAVSVTVDNTFPSYSVNNGATQSVVGGLKEIWPQVLEKAIATISGGYAAISNGGNPTRVMEELTGHTATAMSASSLSLDMLKSFAAAGSLITMDTSSASGLPFGLVSNHAYMFEGVKTVNGVAMVQLGNPWGFNQPSLIPFSQLSKGIVEVDVGRFA